jgi:hypothetical protein
MYHLHYLRCGSNKVSRQGSSMTGKSISPRRYRPQLANLQNTGVSDTDAGGHLTWETEKQSKTPASKILP